VQYFDGKFVDGICNPIPTEELPEPFRSLEERLASGTLAARTD
jgi:hypothetical protein